METERSDGEETAVKGGANSEHGAGDLGLRKRSGRWHLVLVASLNLLPAAFSQNKPISVGEPPPDASPEAELATFKVLDGFEVNLFASEKDGVPNPLVTRWDERGRLWVVSTTAYPQPAPEEVANDKVLILEDTNHDGKADKITTFAEGLRMPMGMELAPGGNAKGHSIYLGEGEKLWLMTDTDGDDKMDTKEVVFSGFGTGDAHQNLNSFIWAPDGSLVMHQGLHCYSRVATAWGVKQLYGAGFWHYRPRSGKLESYPTGMPLNAWGTVFTSEGQPIMLAGAAGMYWARPMEVSTADTDVSGGNLEARDKQVRSIPHFLLERFQLPYGGQCIKTEGLRKFCGIDQVGNGHWPAAMQHEIICGGFFENAVFRYQLRNDPEFPSGIEAIEKEPLITSSSIAFRPVDIRFGPEGALYIADWYDPIIGHYQASFRHPNRDKAHGRIWRVTAKGRPLVQWETITKTSRGEAVLEKQSPNRWAAYQYERVTPPAVQLEQTIDALENLSNTNLLKGINVYWRMLQAAERNETVPALVQQGAMKMLLEAPDADYRIYATHSLGLFADRIPGVLKLIEPRLADRVPRARLEAVVAAAKVAQPEAIKVALKALDQPMDSYLERALWLAVHATARHWQPLTRGFIQDMPPAHIAFLIKRDGSKEVREAATALLKQNDLPANVKEGLTLALAKDDPNPLGLSPDEVATLKQSGRNAARLEALALKTPNAVLRRAALAQLVRTDAGRAGRFVASALGEIKDIEAMKVLLAPVLPTEAATKALVDALKTKPCSADAAKLMMRVLTSTGRSEPELNAVLTQVLGQSSPVPAYTPEWVNTLVAEVKARGDAGKGKVVFSSTLTNCTACHSIAKQGGTIGPELDAVGRGVPIELLVEAVVWPNRQIKEGYIATTISTRDGRRLQGYKISDANGELQLRDLLSANVSRFAAADIVSRQDSGSLMPEGLVGLMTREELRDLIAYLTTLGR